MKESFTAKVTEIGGALCVSLDYGGRRELYDGISYITYQAAPGNELADHLVKTMADNGTKAFGFMVSMSTLPQVWTGPVWKYEGGRNCYDFSQIDMRMDRILKYCPGAMVMVRIYIGADPAWLAENPDERVITVKSGGAVSHRYDKSIITNPDTDYVSIASEKWREVSGGVLRDAIAHTERKYGSNVVGYCISGMSSEEWYHHGWHIDSLDDYSAPMKKAFHLWLRNKYGSEAALREAWGKPLGFTFEDAAIPGHAGRVSKPDSTFYELPREMDIVDFYTFYNEIIPETIESFASYARKAAPGKLIGALYAYQLEFGEFVSGHHRLGRFLEIGDIDYVLIETGYARRHPSRGGDNVRNAFTSIRLHGKVDINDNDTATYRFDEIYPGGPMKEIYRDWLGVAKTPEISGEVIKRITGFSMANGFLSTFFDLHGGYYDHPEILKRAAEAELAYQKHMRMDRRSVAEVLIVVDEKSDMHVRVSPLGGENDNTIDFENNSGNHFLKTQLTTISSSAVKLCAPFDAILLQDIPLLDCSRYKVIIFPNAYALTGEEFEWIKALRGGGRMLVFGYAPGMFLDERKDVSHIYELTGIRVTEGAGMTCANYFFEPSPDPLAGLLYRETLGEAETGIMSGYRYGENNVLIKPSKENGRNIYTTPGAYAADMWVEDEDAVTLAWQTLSDGRETAAFAYKDLGSHTSVYLSTAAITSRVLRALCGYAGVTIYSDHEDTIFANASLITLHAMGSGERSISLPGPCRKAYDLSTGEVLATDSKSFTVEAEDGHTRFIALEH